MGTDVLMCLLYGFKITLSQAFETGLLRPEIMDDDDWQLIAEEDYRVVLIDRHVISPQLRALLGTGEWNLHILSSTQGKCDPAASFLFIYNRLDELYVGRVPDYETGVIGAHPLTEISVFGIEYAVHWIVQGSW